MLVYNVLLINRGQPEFFRAEHNLNNGKQY